MSIEVILGLILGYALGSIPFGLLLTRAAGLGDIRNIGSGNIGATNVLRTGNKGLAAATLLLDAGKGVAAVLIARYIWGESLGDGPAMMAGIGAFFGHCFPVWLGFKGGKGVAVFIGILLALSWPVGLIFCAVWLFMAVVRKFSSLAALTAALTAPLFAYIVTYDLRMAACTALLALVLFYKHTPNIVRLWNGTEPKIGAEKKAAQ